MKHNTMIYYNSTGALLYITINKIKYMLIIIRNSFDDK